MSYISTVNEKEYKSSRKLTKNCRKNKCPYLKYLSGANGIAFCSYILETGKARIKDEVNADPNDCMLWKEEN